MSSIDFSDIYFLSEQRSCVLETSTPGCITAMNHWCITEMVSSVIRQRRFALQNLLKFYNNNNNNDFLCANNFKGEAQWCDKTKGLSNLKL